MHTKIVLILSTACLVLLHTAAARADDYPACATPPDNSYNSAVGTCNIPFTNLTAGSGYGCVEHDIASRCDPGGLWGPDAIWAQNDAAYDFGRQACNGGAIGNVCGDAAQIVVTVIDILLEPFSIIACAIADIWGGCSSSFDPCSVPNPPGWCYGNWIGPECSSCTCGDPDASKQVACDPQCC